MVLRRCTPSRSAPSDGGPPAFRAANQAAPSVWASGTRHGRAIHAAPQYAAIGSQQGDGAAGRQGALALPVLQPARRDRGEDHRLDAAVKREHRVGDSDLRRAGQRVGGVAPHGHIQRADGGLEFGPVGQVALSLYGVDRAIDVRHRASANPRLIRIGRKAFVGEAQGGEDLGAVGGAAHLVGTHQIGEDGARIGQQRFKIAGRVAHGAHAFELARLDIPAQIAPRAVHLHGQRGDDDQQHQQRPAGRGWC